MLRGVLCRSLNISYLCFTLCLMGCFEVTIPAEEIATDASIGVPPDGPSSADTAGISGDSSNLGLNPIDIRSSPFEDIELPAACGSHCDCPQGWDCTNERCVSGSLPIYCCQNDGCPEEADCWTVDGLASVCTQ